MTDISSATSNRAKVAVRAALSLSFRKSSITSSRHVGIQFSLFVDYTMDIMTSNRKFSSSCIFCECPAISISRTFMRYSTFHKQRDRKKLEQWQMKNSSRRISIQRNDQYRMKEFPFFQDRDSVFKTRSPHMPRLSPDGAYQ
jgi:hypothetical protein